jgi:predicted transcriptional regulator
MPQLGASDSGLHALELMQAFHVSELPIVVDSKFFTLIKEEDILNWDKPEQLLSTRHFPDFRPVIYMKAHPYEAAARITELDLSILPVLDEEDKFAGLVTRSELLNFFCDNSGLMQAGGIMVISLKPVDYSLSEIARICENNDIILLNTQIYTYPGRELMDVILKTNRKELQALKASFERYDYQVKEIYGELPAQADLIDRYRLLMNYINM